MKFEDYRTIFCQQDDGNWVAEIPTIPGCYALMPSREEAFSELRFVFEMIEDEFREKGLSLPPDSTRSQ